MAKTLKEKKISQILYISLGGAVIAIILFLVLFNVLTNKNDDLKIGESNTNERSTEEANSSIGKTVDESKKEEKDESVDIQVGEKKEDVVEELKSQDGNDNAVGKTSNNSTANNSVDIANSTNEINSAKQDSSNDNVKQETPKDPNFSMPVEGEIVKHYGKDKLIYSDTLKEWTTHLGIDIKADKTTIVKSAADGSVKSIKNDPRYGLTIVIEHQNGFSSVYANLLSSEFVVVGESVKAGQTIGTVGNSATFEIVDEPHLHFEIMKDGKSVDPEMYVK